jgi:hypothetical protein
MQQRQHRDQRKKCSLDASAKEALRLYPGIVRYPTPATLVPSSAWMTPNPLAVPTSTTLSGALPSFLPDAETLTTASFRTRRTVLPPKQRISPPHPRLVATSKSVHFLPLMNYAQIGDPRLRVFRVQLPPPLLNGLMDDIIDLAESHARYLPGGWRTDLYSLTKCDMACRDVPGMSKQVKPVFEYICHAIEALYGCRRVVVDKNQPHILKYSAASGHTGGKRSLWDVEPASRCSRLPRCVHESLMHSLNTPHSPICL